MGFNYHFPTRVACIALLGLVLAGCGLFDTKENQKTARELAEEGMEAFNDKSFKESIEAFEKLRDWYPFSKYALLAELKLGDAYYHRREYEDAIHAYEEFENLHPKNEAVPYVIYQIGRCYFDRLGSIDRDQSMALEAAQTFERLIASYPDSPYAKKVNDYIRTCRRNLAEHELYVGIFYFKTKHYKAALQRFETVVRDFPDLGAHYRAIQYLSLCQNEMNKLEGDSE